jgi:hypothetical protein
VCRLPATCRDILHYYWQHLAARATCMWLVTLPHHHLLPCRLQPLSHACCFVWCLCSLARLRWRNAVAVLGTWGRATPFTSTCHPQGATRRAATQPSCPLVNKVGVDVTNPP